MGASLPDCIIDEDDGYAWVEEFLRMWAQDQRRERVPAQLSVPRQSAGSIGGGYGGYSKPAEEWQEQADHRAIAVIDAAIEGLAYAEQCAINKFHMIGGAVFRFHRETAEVVYARARMKIGIRLRANDFN